MPNNLTALLIQGQVNTWCELFGGRRKRQLGAEAVGTWVRLFGHLDPVVLREAFDRVTRWAKKLPTPGDVQREVDELLRNLPRTPDGVGRVQCGLCGGSGWWLVPVFAEDGREYQHAVRCTHGVNGNGNAEAVAGDKADPRQEHGGARTMREPGDDGDLP